MPKEGHKTVRNTDGGGRQESVVLESAGPPLHSRLTLPYYERPEPRVRMINESFAPGAVIEPATGEVLPDVSIASLGNAMILEAIIGNDDRVRVSAEHTARNPFRQICSLRIQSQSGRNYVGTAWFISPRVLATAGHCVYLQDDSGWAQSITVIPARSGNAEPFGSFVATKFISVDGWVEQRKRDFDYGAIVLDDDTAGTQVGNFEVRALRPSELKGTDAQISGYPADRDSAAFQYFHVRPLTDITAQRVVYDIDTFGGQSGSPIWQDTEEHGVIAFGIHTTGGLSSNSGTRINEDVLDNLIEWTEGAARG